MSLVTRALPVLLACTVQTHVLAVRRVIVQTHGLDVQSLSAAENSTALLGVNQILKPSGSTVLNLKTALVNVLKTALGDLPLKGEELGGKGCVKKQNCPFYGTVTIKHTGVEVGCGEHLTVQSMNAIHATAIRLSLNVFLDKFVIGVITLDGTVTAVVEIPSLTLTVEKGRPRVDQKEAKAWLLTLTSFTNRQDEGRGSNVGALLQGALSAVPGVQENLGNLVMGLLIDIIVKAIEDNANTFTDTPFVRAALDAARGVEKTINIVTSLGRRFDTNAKC